MPTNLSSYPGPDVRHRPWWPLAVAGGLTVGGLAAVAVHVSPVLLPTTADEAVLLLAWWAAAIVALWWSTSLTFWLVALRRQGSRSHQPRSPRSPVHRLTLPGTRRLAESLLAVGLAVAPACSTDSVAAPSMVLVEEGLAVDETVTTATSTTTTSTTPPTTAPPTTATATTAPPTTATSTTTTSTTATPTTTAPPTPVVDAQHTITVEAGDNLWSLSVETLTNHLGRAPTPEQTAPYWRDVVAANRVRSGNPDLIVPGEPITMPPLPDVVESAATAAG